MHRMKELLELFGFVILTAILFSSNANTTWAGEEKTVDSIDLIQISSELKGLLVQIVVPLGGDNLSVGSGFWIDNRGYVATCWHVIKGNPTASIIVQSGTDPLFDLNKNVRIFSNWVIFHGKLIAKDEINDLALLKVENNPFASIPPTLIKIGDIELKSHYKVADLKTDLPVAGQKVLLAGYPLARPYSVFQEGNVASIAHSLPEFGETFKILISTVANPGNSGGPLLDRDGKVIGILQGGLPSRWGKDPAQAQSGIAAATPSYFLNELMDINLKK